ncbi:MAG: rRNA maturation RNase YbeY [Gammaproteobacteria bacterium]|nr:rRNA maturation RNase YbeY [Gammaproteobacteria bacterium]
MSAVAADTGAPPPALRLTLQNESLADGLPSRALFRRWAAAAIRAERERAGELPVALCLRLVDGVEGRALNRRYRNKDYATNVLSFASEHLPFMKLKQLGDIVLCVPVVRREAKAQGKSIQAHLAHLTIHGILHLLGYAHERPGPARAMERREVTILASLGYADPYQ